MREVVVIGLARTPVGKFAGTLAALAAPELGGRAIAGALERAGCPSEDVDYVVMGHVLQAGVGQLSSRQAALAGGIGMQVPSETINKVCLSGMTAIARARDLIATGAADVVVAGGMESMSNAPYLLDGARFGYRMGPAEIVDSMLFDGLTCAIDGCAMGLATDRYQSDKQLAISREQQDEFAARSHERAATATKDGLFADEIVALEVSSRREVTTVEADEGIRPDTTPQSLSGLRPAFDAEGTITAGNASQISDGAAALVLASAEYADRHHREALAVLGAWGSVAGPDASLHLQPANAIRTVLSDAGLDVEDLDLVEINEAFASVAIASMRDLGLDEERVNVRGGAIALGHPIGSSGARIVTTLIAALRSRGGGTGVAALCGGGGQGDALVVTSA